MKPPNPGRSRPLPPSTIFGLDASGKPYLGVAAMWRLHDFLPAHSSAGIQWFLFAEVRNDSTYRPHSGHCCAVDFFVLPGPVVALINEMSPAQIVTFREGRRAADAVGRLWSGDPHVVRPEVTLDPSGHPGQNPTVLSHYIFAYDDLGYAQHERQGWSRQAGGALRMGAVLLILNILQEPNLVDRRDLVFMGPGYSISREADVPLEDVMEHFAAMRNPE